MALSFMDNVDYRGKKPNFTRDLFETKEDMKNYSENYLPDVFITSCKEDGKIYVFNRSNSISPTTGKWRVIEGGGGSSTLSEDLTAAFAIGSIQEGEVFTKGTGLEDIFRKLLEGAPTTKKASYYGVANSKIDDLTQLIKVDSVASFSATVSANNQYVIFACPKDAGTAAIFSFGFDYTSSFTTVDKGDYVFFYSETPITCDDFSYTITYN